MLDQILRRRPEDAARAWTEHRPGLKSTCEKCGAIGRTWIGRYRQRFALLLGYSLHASGPRCVSCVIQTEKLETHLTKERAHDWRSEMAVQT